MAELQTQTSLSDEVKTNYLRRLLMRAVPRLVHGRWAVRERLNKFGSAEWRKFSALTTTTTALTEGVTPSAESVSVTTVTATPSFYGAFIRHTDELEMTAFDPLLMAFSAILGEQAGVSVDTLIRNTITANATKDYSSGQTARTALTASTHDIAYSDVVIAVATLMGNDALPVEGDTYIVIVHPHTWATLMQDTTFTNTFQRAGPRDDNNPMRSGLLGHFLMCDFYMSSNSREYVDGGASNADVYSMLFIGRESYGCVGIGNATPRDVDPAGPAGQPLTGKGRAVSPVDLIVKPLGSAGADDPLNQRATCAWKAALDTQVLNSAWIVDMEHTNSFS